MQQILKFLLVSFLLSSTFAGCKKDDKDSEISGYFKVNGKTYELNSGMLEYYGEDDWYDGYNVDLYLLSPGLSVSNSFYSFVEGKGDAVVFEMFSALPRTLAPGVYEFVEYDDEEVMPVESFDFGGYALGVDADTEDVEVERVVVSGSITVNKEGSNYTIDFDCTDILGNSLIGHFKGSLKFFDYSEDAWEAKSEKVSGKKRILR